MGQVIKKYGQFLALGLIFIGGVFLRTYHLGTLPASMHRDELAIAYNAYSLLETGRDEWGQPHPWFFKSFGDYKQPGMVYGTIPGIWGLGLTPLGARLPAALISAVAILAVFLLVKTIFKSEKMALLSSLALAFSLWHIRDARNIYEPVVILTFSILSYWALYKAREKTVYLGLSIALFVVSSLIYNTAVFIYLPLLMLWLGYGWRKFSPTKRQQWLLGLVAAILIAGGMLGGGLEVSAGKSQTTIFYNSTLINEHEGRIYRFWKSGLPIYPGMKAADRVFQVGYRFAKSYLASIDMNYLFFKGGNNAWHNFASIDMGEMNPVLLPFFIVGLIYVWQRRRHPTYFFILALLLVSPLPSSLTIDAPNTNRLIDFHLIVMLVAVLGFYRVLSASQKWQRYLAYLGIFLYLVFFSQFLGRYFGIYNKLLADSWYAEVPAMVQAVESEKSNYDWVYIEPPISALYIYYAFYSQLPPEVLQTAVGQGALDFNTVSQLGNVVFGKYLPPIDEATGLLKEEKVLVVTTADEGVDEEDILVIRDWDGQPVYVGSEYQPPSREGKMLQ
jgi:4-amino-4-deoxy-L-arabinose transferase-like glycosyltransferase